MAIEVTVPILSVPRTRSLPRREINNHRERHTDVQCYTSSSRNWGHRAQRHGPRETRALQDENGQKFEQEHETPPS